jgi:hypothetical protein
MLQPLVERVIVDSLQAVAPHRDEAVSDEHPAGLFIEAGEVDPVERLGYGDQVHRGVGQAALGRRSHAIRDARMARRLGDLRRAGVGRRHAGEARGESQRGLSIPGCAVPCVPASRRQAREMMEQRRRIRGARRGIRLRDGGEVIGEVRGHGAGPS